MLRSGAFPIIVINALGIVALVSAGLVRQDGVLSRAATARSRPPTGKQSTSAFARRRSSEPLDKTRATEKR
jgi:hypothetical protein